MPMGRPGANVLVDGVAVPIASDDRKDAIIAETTRDAAEMGGRMEGTGARITERGMVIPGMGRRMIFYENPHAPPSQGPLPEQKGRASRRSDPSERKKPGRGEGHDGMSRHNAARTVHRTPGGRGATSAGPGGSGLLATQRRRQYGTCRTF